MNSFAELALFPSCDGCVSGALWNLSRHPANRDAFYKAELQVRGEGNERCRVGAACHAAVGVCAGSQCWCSVRVRRQSLGCAAAQHVQYGNWKPSQWSLSVGVMPAGLPRVFVHINFGTLLGRCGD